MAAAECSRKMETKSDENEVVVPKRKTRKPKRKTRNPMSRAASELVGSTSKYWRRSVSAMGFGKTKRRVMKHTLVKMETLSSGRFPLDRSYAGGVDNANWQFLEEPALLEAARSPRQRGPTAHACHFVKLRQLA